MSISAVAPPQLERFLAAARRAPREPYRSLAAFRFADAGILAARDWESVRLIRLITMYRGVLLYGQSGAGKSSVVNAGLLPLATEDGFWPHRVRVQPRPDHELVIEPIACSDDPENAFLPFAFGPDAPGTRLVLSVEDFEAVITAAALEHRVLLVFDQFEELVTLFPATGPERESAERILGMLTRLLRHETLPVKLVFVFREDYLASLRPLLEAQPELAHQNLRLVPPPLSAAVEIIRAPFERFRYDRELSAELAERIASELTAHSNRDELSLSALQIVCSRLWRERDPAAVLKGRKVSELLEDHLDEALAQLGGLRDAAVAVLVQMITPSGTRNVVSAADLIERARSDQPELTPQVLSAAIERLESESGLIRRERRHDVDLYELVSEFLIPRISLRRQELEREKERRKLRRRMIQFGVLAAVAVAVVAIVAVLAVRARDAAQSARQQKARATYIGLASSAQALAPIRPDVSLLLGLAAYLHVPSGSSPELAASSLMSAFDMVSSSGAVGILHGHTDTVTRVAFDPTDPSLLASASGDGTVRLWNATTHKIEAVFADPSEAVFGVAFSPDGRELVTSDEGGHVRIYDVATHRLLALAPGALSGIAIRVVYSPDGRELAAASLSGQIRIWPVINGRPAGPAKDLPDPFLRSIAFSGDSRLLAAVGNDGEIRVWHVATWTQAAQHKVRGDHLFAVAFRPGSDELAAGGLRSQAYVWNPAASRGPFTPVDATGGTIQDLAFNDTGTRLGAADANGTLRIVDLAHPGPVTVLGGHTGVVTSLAFAPGGDLVAGASVDRTVLLWDLRAHDPFGAAIGEPAGSVSAVAFSHDGQTLAAASWRRGVELWNVASGSPIGAPVPDSLRARSVALSPDGQLVAFATQRGVVGISGVQNHSTAEVVLRHRRAPMYAVAWSPNSQLLAFAGNDGAVELWHRSGQTLTSLSGPTGVPVYALAFSPDGQTLATGGDDRKIRLWNVARGGPTGTLVGVTDAIFGLAFSPNGQLLASGSADDTVRLWSVSGRLGEVGAPLTGHHSYVRGVAFSPDGQTLASASKDGTVRLWSVTSRTEVGEPLHVSAGSVEGVTFSSRGLMATGSTDGAARIWPDALLPSGAALSTDVCRLVGSGLSRAEWSEYAPGLAYEPLCR